QRYTLIRSRFVAESSTVSIAGAVPRRWRVGRDVYWLPSSAVAPRDVAGRAVVLVGVPADSLRAFAGTDLRGAILIQLADDRPNRPGTPMWLLRAAAKGGAVAAILVRNLPPEQFRASM